MNPQISPETITSLKIEYGLDRPLPVRYVRWVNSVVHGRIWVFDVLPPPGIFPTVVACPKYIVACLLGDGVGVDDRAELGNPAGFAPRRMARSVRPRADGVIVGSARIAYRFAAVIAGGAHGMVSNRWDDFG